MVLDYNKDMNILKVLEELKATYPGKKIVLNDRNRCTEILCEIEPSSQHPTFSKAIAVIDLTKPHFHNSSTETYEVLRGTLTMSIDGIEREMHEGDTVTITPGQIHFAKGNETWISCLSKPGWKHDDHHIVD